MDSPHPSISIVLPTRDRPHDLNRALTAILASRGVAFEVIVVDQSESFESARIVQRLRAHDPRVVLVSDRSGRGSSRARNLGASASRGDIIAFTDDDCEVAPDWLAVLEQEFAVDPTLGIVCGTVVAAPYDADAGFIVGYVPRTRRRFRGRLAKLADAGIGANLAFRRSAIEAVGGWDELLGAGSTFDGAADLDLIYRVLAAGYPLLHVPAAVVTHWGFRPWSVGGQVMRGRFRGIGAAYAKHIRLGDAVAAVLLTQQLALGLANLFACIVQGGRPLGVGRLMALLSGVRDSFAYRIDRAARVYASTHDKGAARCNRTTPSVLPRERKSKSVRASTPRPAQP